MIWQLILDYIHLIITIIILPVIAFKLTQYIKSKFSKEFEKFKSDLENIKLQKLHDLDLLLTRRINWHEKEQEVLSKSWEEVMKVKKTLTIAIHSFNGCPDFTKINYDELERIIKDFDADEKIYWKKTIKEDVRENGFNAYKQIMDTRNYNELVESVLNFNNYFYNNSIFLRPHIKEKFLDLLQQFGDLGWFIKSNLDDHYQKIKSGSQDAMQAWVTYKNEILPLIKEIEDVIRKELFPDPKDKP